VPCGDDSVTVVRAASGQVIATVTGNGLSGASAAAFDGERILVANSIGNSVSLWRASDLRPLGSYSTGAFSNPQKACSDGINFWVVLAGPDRLARY
jgi:DNA-binding beta-propeller fold protein YncE